MDIVVEDSLQDIGRGGNCKGVVGCCCDDIGRGCNNLGV